MTPAYEARFGKPCEHGRCHVCQGCMVAWTSVPPEPSDWVCEGCEPAFEAGRLAAIRAEVEQYVCWLDEHLPEREGCHPDDVASQDETRQMYVELRDLCRWLEATR